MGCFMDYQTIKYQIKKTTESSEYMYSFLI